MDRKLVKKLTQRAVELGKSGDGNALPELIQLLENPAAQVRRLAASAVGKLAGSADANSAVQSLHACLSDEHSQVRQYAIKALALYGASAQPALADLEDIAANPSEKEYNRENALRTAGIIREVRRIAEKQAEHVCQRCSIVVNSDEYARSQKAFQRVFCDKCFDEVYLKRRNFDTKVELSKTIQARDGTIVQSHGERIIAEYLDENNVAYRYDERFRILEGFAIRPDYYLPELDLYIEYWGMDTADYKIGMLKKQKLYQQEGKKVISLYFRDIGQLKEVLAEKLGKYLQL